LEGKTVLDCGCGEGYNAREMTNSAAKVVGYDIKEDPNWPGRSKDNLILTTEKPMVTSSAPYDVVVLYDVLDHLQGEDPEAFMQWISSMVVSGGRIFTRTHPWTSKTGGHFYETANKAWLHLALTPDELAKAGLTTKEPNLRIIRPMAAYELWFKNAGLTVEDKQVKAEEVDEWFTRNEHNSLLQRIIKVTWAGTVDETVARRIMSNQWIDYLLKK
jgi:2-polyprenyl-3-methyl-5-hydroxy-6-metoxy-1,4-benzoquinol methylase